MKTQTKLFTVVGIAALLVVALAIGGWFVNTAFAQGPWQGGFMGMGLNNQAVLTLLKTNESDLLKQRQQGKSLLDIASAQSVSEQALTDALLQPMNQMQGWMMQNYPQANTAQMTEWMRQQFAQDIRVVQYGTMTDMHILGGSMMNGMMGNGNGNNGFGGMMGGGNSGSGGMMNGNGMMGGGMMGGWNNTPNVNATSVPSTQKIDREVTLTARNFKFSPATVTVKKGETVKFTIANQDSFAHNFVSRDGNIIYTEVPANSTQSVTWVAPTQAGTFTAICTYHPGMQLQIVVE